MVGTQIIFDVEQEKTIYQEMICDGTNAWQQWQEALKSQRFHLVRPGETLSAISHEYYGSASQWRRIFEANRGTVQDANTARSGTKLIIPE